MESLYYLLANKKAEKTLIIANAGNPKCKIIKLLHELETLIVSKHHNQIKQM